MAGREAAARLRLLVNLLVLPGLGTLAAGQRLAGVAQAGLAILGFALVVLALGSYVVAWIRAAAPPAAIGPQLATGLAGLGLFALAWFWSFASGLALLRGEKDR
jgi:hypothetical protein